MKNTPLTKLGTFGQSVWLDYIKRDLIIGGELRRMIEEDGLRGMTSNPAIFEKAIAGNRDYDEDVEALALAGKETREIYETLSQGDVKGAADAFRSVYDETDGADGYVSLEVNPHLAYATKGTIEEARRLWAAVSRPNVLIKVPATAQGLPAIQQLLAEGINVNVTLLFGLPRYLQVAEAYIKAVEARVSQRKSVARLASVASFFVSRVDSLLDPLLEKIAAENGRNAETARNLRGQVSVAGAKAAYQIYKEIFGSERFGELSRQGARSQRLLWASTSAKNPKYSDVKYVEALIGPATVNTMPLETFNAYRDHGDPKARLEQDVDKARQVLEQLGALGIDIDDVTQQLENEGVEKFNQPFDALMAALAKKTSRFPAKKT